MTTTVNACCLIGPCGKLAKIVPQSKSFLIFNTGDVKPIECIGMHPNIAS